MTRREALALLAASPLAAVSMPEGGLVQIGPLARGNAQPAAPAAWEPAFFTEHEMATVRVLADMVIPADERSGSATDAGAPEFMDYTLAEIQGDFAREAMRGGLAWLDAESRRRYDGQFLDASEPQRAAILDDIAWPDRARPEMSHGVAFFNRFRDLLASAFWSSEMGVRDLRYVGNTVVMRWEGCPPEALEKLGVGYE
jgi:gluconate 2-dehydrogenase gamma chain